MIKLFPISETLTVPSHGLDGRPFQRQARDFEVQHWVDCCGGLRVGPLDRKRMHRFIFAWPQLRVWVWIWGGRN